jgi:hydroxymethylpyrimidine/phosphomethylpyrimidine kinase
VVELAAMAAAALTIAGVDPSGGAGIAADLKAFHQHGVYGCAVVTLITAQNTMSVRRVQPLPADLVAEQLDAVLDDVALGAAKTGALGSAEIVRVVAQRFRDRRIPLIVDPVRVAKHSAELLAAAARGALIDDLLPASCLVTANADEAAWLCERAVCDEAGARAAAERLQRLGARAVLIKGGHLTGGEAVDVLRLEDGSEQLLRAPRITARHTHGVGCTLSAAITANLALGLPLLAACERAKTWISAAIAGAPGVGRGIGAVDHSAPVPPLADRR